MSSRALLALAFASAALTASAGPALALSGQCFWSHLEVPTRQNLLDGYQRDGPAVLDRIAISDRELASLDEQCDARSVDPSIKERLLAATVFEHGSAVFLKGWLRWDDGAIQAAWLRLSPEQAAGLRRQAEGVLAGQPPDPSGNLGGATGAFLGRDPSREDPALIDQVRGYLTSRSMREAIERLS